MPPNKAQRAKTAQRRVELLKLRIAGVPFEDPRILEGLGYKKRGNATKDMVRILETHVAEEKAGAAVYRQQENERLDVLLAAVWKQATTPTPRFDKNGEHTHDEIDVRAVDSVLRLMDRRAKLNGLDAPVKTEVSGPDGGAVPLGAGTLSELHTLISIVGDPSSGIPTPDEAQDEEGGADSGDHSDQ